ncbi:hypothetical protein A3F66_06170 [candidate division TM6 bacterium RIFCSPHIGHO2_12_FULL_32_22]|nr:MAG: hypothetical protein A3F66_06170 [candidate division TM6 bacterium RIFCSPHIGHO2_12_FULL_32_22]
MKKLFFLTIFNFIFAADELKRLETAASDYQRVIDGASQISANKEFLATVNKLLIETKDLIQRLTPPARKRSARDVVQARYNLRRVKQK